MDLQIRMMEAVVAANPGLEYYIWNLARNRPDSKYLHNLEPSERVTVRHDFDAVLPWRDNLGKVWRHYTSEEYKDCLFVKLDDDIVFIESARFSDYVQAIDSHRGSVVSANVINNGACCRVQPALWARYQPRSLLEVHRYKKFAELAHTWFFSNWREMVGAAIEVAETQDWLSINAIGFDWATLNEIVGRIGQPSPRMISGRAFQLGMPIGDEGSVNLLPRMIMRGFTVAHLAFGPQATGGVTEQMLAHWRDNYSKIGREYLAGYQPAPTRKRGRPRKEVTVVA